MDYPPLMQDKTPSEYRAFFETSYCRGPVLTFDGIEVRFRKRDFNHCFFESVNNKDDTFSTVRAERLLWIKAALQDPDSERYIGWDKSKKTYDKSRRVALVKDNYVVVIALIGVKNAEFVTAFVADNERTLRRIKCGPRWT